MISNCFVIDSVVHAHNLTPENQLVQPVSGALSEMIYSMHLATSRLLSKGLVPSKQSMRSKTLNVLRLSPQTSWKLKQPDFMLYWKRKSAIP